MQSIVVAGCGDIGLRVTRLCCQQNVPVRAVVKTQTSQDSCQNIGIETQRIDLDAPLEAINIPPFSRILYTVPPPSSGSSDPRIEAFLAAIDASKIDKFVLISTTGVYGDCDGEWVDEDRPVRPQVDRAHRRVAAELALTQWAQETSTDIIILRVPGIYAADRLPLKRLRSLAPVLLEDQSPWSNRIHADDLAVVCYAALTLSIKNEIIHVSDDAPSSMTEYFFAVADYAKLPRPRQISLAEAQQQLSAGMIGYLAESKRIDNTKMKRLLKVRLRYPSIEAGLKH